jgi:hypothetical protein
MEQAITGRETPQALPKALFKSAVRRAGKTAFLEFTDFELEM